MPIGSIGLVSVGAIPFINLLDIGVCARCLVDDLKGEQGKLQSQLKPTLHLEWTIEADLLPGEVGHDKLCEQMTDRLHSLPPSPMTITQHQTDLHSEHK